MASLILVKVARVQLNFRGGCQSPTNWSKEVWMLVCHQLHRLNTGWTKFKPLYVLHFDIVWYMLMNMSQHLDLIFGTSFVHFGGMLCSVAQCIGRTFHCLKLHFTEVWERPMAGYCNGFQGSLCFCSSSSHTGVHCIAFWGTHCIAF